MPSFRQILGGAALAFISVAGAAQATPSISVAVSESSSLSGLSTIFNSASGFVGGGFSTANFAGTVSAEGSPILPQPTLETSSIDARTTAAHDGTLYVYITEQGLTSPQGVANFFSSFTANSFAGGAVSVIEKTFISTTDALWTGTALASQTFTGLNTGSFYNLSPSLSSPFSETAEFIVHINGVGSVNDTINISDPVPEPMSIALLGAGLIGLGAVHRRRRVTRSATC